MRRSMAWAGLIGLVEPDIGGRAGVDRAAAATACQRQRGERRQDAKPCRHGRTSTAGARRLAGADGALEPPNSQ